MATDAVDKGKARTTKAVEHTPLLDDHGNPADEEVASVDLRLEQAADVAEATPLPTFVSCRSHLLTATFVLTSIFFAFIIATLLLAKSYAAPALQNINLAISQPEGDTFWREALVVRGPDAVNLLGLGATGGETGPPQPQINISVTMRMTIDTDFVMDLRETPIDGWWTRRWKNLGRWAVRRLGSASVILDNVIIYPSSSTTASPPAPIFSVAPLSPITVSLSPGLSSGKVESLDPVIIPFTIRPSNNVSLLRDFVETSWKEGFVDVRLHGANLQLFGGVVEGKPPRWWQIVGWRNWLRYQIPTIAVPRKIQIPPINLPSHPPIYPGSKFPPLSELLILESFSITTGAKSAYSAAPDHSYPIPIYPVFDNAQVDATSRQRVLVPAERTISVKKLSSSQQRSLPDGRNIIISAQASLPHPFLDFASKLDLDMSSMPFLIALPVPQTGNNTLSSLSHTSTGKRALDDIIPVAQVIVSPSFNTTHVLIHISGYILPFKDSPGNLPDAVSKFASAYLSYTPADIAIFCSLYPALVLRTSFPPPSHRLKLLRDVKIENMRIRPGFGPVYIPGSMDETVSDSFKSSLHVMDLLASATVHARAVLPPGLNIDINVSHVWIDMLVFDGEVPKSVNFMPSDSRNAELPSSSIEDSGVPPVPQPRPLPNPLPPRAFARIKPKTWLNATSTRLPPAIRGGKFYADGDYAADDGTNVSVTAEIVDVPLEVLPGREDELSKFITKVVFSSDPVVAGIRGVAAVGVTVPGLTASARQVQDRELVLTGLPFEGNIKIGGH